MQIVAGLWLTLWPTSAPARAAGEAEITIPQRKESPWRLNDSVCVNRAGRVICGEVVRANRKEVVLRLDLQGKGIDVLPTDDMPVVPDRAFGARTGRRQPASRVAMSVNPAPGNVYWDRVQLGPIVHFQPPGGANLAVEVGWVPVIGLFDGVFVRLPFSLTSGKNQSGQLFPIAGVGAALGIAPARWFSIAGGGGYQHWFGNGGSFVTADATLLVSLVGLGLAGPDSSILVPAQIAVGYSRLLSSFTTHQLRLQAVFALGGL